MEAPEQAQAPPENEVENRLDAFLEELPAGPQAQVAAPAPPAPETSQYVTHAQYEAQQRELEALRSVAPIAQELARNPQVAERLRQQLILGDVAAPGTHASSVQPLAPQAPPQMSPEDKQRIVNALITDPMSVIGPAAQGYARQMVEAEMAPMRASQAQTAFQLFQAAKMQADADEYKAVAPLFQAALANVDLAQLSRQDPRNLQGFLDVTWRAARGDAYAEILRNDTTSQSAPPGAVPLTAVPGGRAAAPPYVGAAGAPSSAATGGLVRQAQRRTQLSAAELDLARRSGLTKEDMQKYLPDVLNELNA